MSASKKDYDAIAHILRTIAQREKADYPTLGDVRIELATYFASGNPRFNIARFVQASSLPIIAGDE